MLMTIPFQTCCVEITVAGRPARIAAFLPRRGWSLHNKGYLIYTPNPCYHLRRGIRAHVAAVEHLLGVPRLPDGFEIHHQDFDKLNCCPRNLLYCTDPVFNRHGGLYRDPYTGQRLTADEWYRRYDGLREARRQAERAAAIHDRASDVPDWVNYGDPNRR